MMTRAQTVTPNPTAQAIFQNVNGLRCPGFVHWH